MSSAACCCSDELGPCGLPSDYPTNISFSSSFRVEAELLHPPFSTAGTVFSYETSMTLGMFFDFKFCVFRYDRVVGTHSISYTNPPSGYSSGSEQFRVDRYVGGTPQFGILQVPDDVRFHKLDGTPNYSWTLNSGSTNYVLQQTTMPTSTPFMRMEMTVLDPFAAINGYSHWGSFQTATLYWSSSLTTSSGNVVPDLRTSPSQESVYQKPVPNHSPGTIPSVTPMAARYGSINVSNPIRYPWTSGPDFHADPQASIWNGTSGLTGYEGVLTPTSSGYNRPSFPSSLVIFDDRGVGHDWAYQNSHIGNVCTSSTTSVTFS